MNRNHRSAACVSVACSLACAILLAIASCTPTAQEKAHAAEATYTGQLAECVDKSATRAEADGCAASVRQKWTVNDAGAER